jgi:hypothetical protein
MENAGDIINLASVELKDPNKQHFTEAMLLSWASSGQREICRRTHCLRKETANITGNLVVDTIAQSYSVLIPDVDVIGIFNVHCGSKQRALDFTTIPQLDRDNSTWRATSSGTPLRIAPGPNDTLIFDPPPSADWISDYELYIIYSCLPLLDFTDDSQVPEIHPKCWDYIKDWCVMMGKLEDRELVTFDRLFMIWKDGLAYIKSEPKIQLIGATSQIVPIGGIGLNPPR